jgi:hypothetical protein
MNGESNASIEDLTAFGMFGENGRATVPLCDSFKNALLSAQFCPALRSALCNWTSLAASQQKDNCFTGQPAFCLNFERTKAAKTVN